jgi:hypothetical protein
MVRDYLPALLRYLWHTHIALIIVGDELDVIDANDASLALSGYHHHHMIGKPLPTFLDVDYDTAAQLEQAQQNFHRKTNTSSYNWTLVRSNQQPLEVMFAQQWIVKCAGALFHVIVMMPLAERHDIDEQLEAAIDTFFAQRQHAKAKQHKALAFEALASDDLDTIIALHRAKNTSPSHQAVTTPTTSPVILNVSNDISGYDDITVKLSDSHSQQDVYYKQASRAYVLDLRTSSYNSTYKVNGEGDNEMDSSSIPAQENAPLSDDTLRQLIWDFR